MSGSASFQIVPLNEMEVGTRVGSPHIRHLPPANPVRIGDDVTVRCLPEHLGETHNGHDSALDQVMEHRARPNGRKLIHTRPESIPSGSGEPAPASASAAHPPSRFHPRPEGRRRAGSIRP